MKHLLPKLLCTLFLHSFDNSALVNGTGQVHCRRCHKAWNVDSAAHTMEPLAERTHE